MDAISRDPSRLIPFDLVLEQLSCLELMQVECVSRGWADSVRLACPPSWWTRVCADAGISIKYSEQEPRLLKTLYHLASRRTVQWPDGGWTLNSSAQALGLINSASIAFREVHTSSASTHGAMQGSIAAVKFQATPHTAENIKELLGIIRSCYWNDKDKDGFYRVIPHFWSHLIVPLDTYPIVFDSWPVVCTAPNETPLQVRLELFWHDWEFKLQTRLRINYFQEDVEYFECHQFVLVPIGVACGSGCSDHMKFRGSETLEWHVCDCQHVRDYRNTDQDEHEESEPEAEITSGADDHDNVSDVNAPGGHQEHGSQLVDPLESQHDTSLEETDGSEDCMSAEDGSDNELLIPLDFIAMLDVFASGDEIECLLAW